MNTPAIVLALSCALAAGITHARALPAAAAVKPTDADLGDSDSYQRAGAYLGLASTKRIVLVGACPLDDPAPEICIVRAPGASPTAFDFPSPEISCEGQQIAAVFPAHADSAGELREYGCRAPRGLVHRQHQSADRKPAGGLMREFFVQPMTVTLGARGSATAVSLVAFSFGVRLYGDK